MKKRIKKIDYAQANTAMLYPIALPNKLVILLSLPDKIEHYSTEVPFSLLKDTVLSFRLHLQTRPHNRFLYEAWQLYDWIIRPAEEKIKQRDIHTIVVAPDGPLRLIPFSTLNDGEEFLIEKYAIGTVPAISLTDPKPLNKENIKILLAGLSHAVQDFSPLPSVNAELRDIKKIMHGKILLQNTDYTINNLRDEFKNNEYTIVHLATHGVFGDRPDNSFVLTYYKKMTMNLLEQLIALSKYRKNPVELLTLSACQTALGNERAALGLAGVAVKAGVRTAIATLWYVDDEATSLGIREFYRQLQKPGISKARALQNVQKKLISQYRYWHPGYWAPFLIIGNWM